MPFIIALRLAGSWIGSGAAWLWHPSRRIGVIAAISATLIAILIFQVRSHRAKAEALTEALRASQGEVALLRQARAADSAALSVTRETKTAIQTKEAHGLQRTREALAANPDWANTPVPPDVIGSLRQD